MAKEELRWRRSTGTLGFPCPSNKAVLRSDHLEHPGNGHAEWQKDLYGWRETVWQVQGVRIRTGGEKTALPQRGENPFRGETDKRERKRGVVKARH